MGAISTKLGCCQPSAAEQEIAKVEQKMKYQQQKEIKMLLYGTGECGKTTILRQMRIAHGNGVTEKIRLRNAILQNVVEGAATTIRFGRQYLQLKFPDYADEVMAVYKGSRGSALDTNSKDLDPKIVEFLTDLYLNCDAFKQTLERRSEYQIPEGWLYYADSLTKSPKYPTWGGRDWEPSNEDYLRVRVRTIGSSPYDFVELGTNFRVHDVGGQRSERMKFFQLFAKVDSIIHVVSLSEYDQKLFEDERTNRLVESLEVWKKTVNNVQFQQMYFFLFFNKVDLLREKFYHQQKPIPNNVLNSSTPPPLPSEETDDKCEKSLQWFQNLFNENVKESRRPFVKQYVVCALDSQDLQNKFRLVANFLLHHGVGSI